MRNICIVKTVVVGPLETNCYIVGDSVSKEALIIDPGFEGPKIVREISNSIFTPIKIINTHGHADHICANEFLKSEYNIPVCIHSQDKDYLTDPNLNGSYVIGNTLQPLKADILFNENDIVKIGNIAFKVMHTPGHSPGGICLVSRSVIFTGDTLFYRSVGRWDLPGGNEAVLLKSLKKFINIDKKLIVYPGHGRETNIEDEIKHNPFLAEEE